MTRKLQIAEDQTLPIDAITQRISVLGRTGSGKSHTAMVVVEEVLALHQQVVVLDPKGDFWGLRSSADGKGPGYPITVFGGEHGDIPLEPTSGTLVADLVIREGISAILDLSMFESKAEENRFATDFADRLYRKNRKAMLFVIDESDQMCPQQPMPEERRMLSKFDIICRRGRSRGIGVMLLSQRSAAIHKGCLSQTELMLAHQTTGPQDRKAIELWVKGKGTEEQQAQFMSRLASLKTGEAILWSPSWLNVFKEIKVREKRTYDSSATPTVGARRRAPKVLAKVDLERLKQHMATTLEQAKQEDPKLLRERIVELEREIAKAARFRNEVDRRSKLLEQKIDKVQPQVQQMAERLTEKTRVVEKLKRVKVEIPLLKKRQYNELEKLVARCEKVMSHLDSAGMRFEVFTRCLWPDIVKIRERLDEMKNIKPTPPKLTIMEQVFPKPVHPRLPRRTTVITAKNEVIQAPFDEMSKLKAGQRRMLQTLATYHPTELTKEQLGTLSLISPSSGTFSNYLGLLRAHGYVIVEDRNVSISESGLAYLEGDYPEKPTSTEARVTAWGRVLKAGQRRMLEVLVQAAGNKCTKEELGQAAGIEPSSGTFSNYLGALKRNGLADVEGKDVHASSALFV